MMQMILRYISLFVLLLLTSCYTVKPPEFQKADNVSINYANDIPQIRFNISGHNPNNWSFRLSELKMLVTIDGLTKATIQADTTIRLKSGADFTIPASLTTSQKDLEKIISSGLSIFLSGKKIPLEVNGDFTLKKFLFRKNFSFELKEEIDPNSFH